jgi:hypothetical protein
MDQVSALGFADDRARSCSAHVVAKGQDALANVLLLARNGATYRIEQQELCLGHARYRHIIIADGEGPIGKDLHGGALI